VVNVEDLSRLILTIVHAVIVILAVAHYRKRPDTRAYTILVISLGFVNFVFYAMAYTWRVGEFIPPTPDFFSTLSNLRSWGMALAALIVLTVEVRDIWIGDR
jgi:hypothetical protein